MSRPLSPPPPLASPASASASNQAVTALVLGFLGVVCCCFVAPVAWYLGQAEGRAIREGRAPVAGEGMAMAGKILGMIGTALLVLCLLLGGFWILFFGGLEVLQELIKG